MLPFTRAPFDRCIGLGIIQGNGTSVGAATANVWADVNFVATSLNGKSSDITEGTGKTFTLQLNQAAKAGDTLTLAASGLGSYTKAVLGDTTVIADGAVITLTEGQTVVSFALIQEGSDLTADANGTLTASYACAKARRAPRTRSRHTSKCIATCAIDTGARGHFYR